MTMIDPRTRDAVLAGFYTSISGWCFADFARSMANYQAQAEAITHRIYSGVQTITPEVAEQTSRLIYQIANKPDYFDAILGVVTGVFAIGLVVKSVNEQNYKE